MDNIQINDLSNLDNLNKEELLNLKKNLEEQLIPINDKLLNIYKKESLEIDERIDKAFKGYGNFKDTELRYSAIKRCVCGAGLAYPKNKIDLHGSWYCSNILLGKADKSVQHDKGFPFAFYEIKSENESSAHNQTTRPN